MSKIFKLLLFCFLYFLNACKNDSEIKKTNENLKSIKVDSLKFSNDDEFRDITIAFFNWYKLNNNKLGKIKFLKGGYINENDSIAYYIDENEVNKYVKEFDKTGYVSHSYIENLKNHLLSVGKDLKEEKIYDGVVGGLDYDLITKSQDDEEIFSTISTIKLIGQKIISKDDVENYYELRKNTLFLKISYTFEDKWKIENYDFEYK
ncbi:hypothetical protein RF683_07270 [Flavobacterium sp. 20NA77.7]|uniref:Lipoprotein n=1 Tax=Flavobacterium nakdongensis TaxID=3073563 RepID=A0ABY9RAC8_9FLAO|nr:hypothetical protein [Flavobacterium sp. 20NA77.7]WMW77290.1 hypothetical protein RF683_07270 [Flavobacterium sp. 20NA77.7]